MTGKNNKAVRVGRRRRYADSQLRSKRQVKKRIKGKITSWNDEKGFGFITPGSGEKQLFIHIKSFSNHNRRPKVNQFVTYALSSDKQGRPCAKNAKFTDERFAQKTKQKNNSLAVVTAIIFLIIVGISVFTANISPLVLALYTGSSILTFIFYAMDKLAAKKGAWRTQESTLHILSLAGGWPGAIIAQQKLHHKSKKKSFRLVFWVTVFLNCSAFFLLLTPTGTATLQ